MKRVKCCDCNRWVETNKRRHYVMAEHLRPLLLFYMGYKQDTQKTDFRPHVFPDSVFCSRCFANIRNYQLGNKLPSHVVERLEMRKRAGIVRPCHKRGEAELLENDPIVKKMKEADPGLFSHIADALVPEPTPGIGAPSALSPPSESGSVFGMCWKKGDTI